MTALDLQSSRQARHLFSGVDSNVNGDVYRNYTFPFDGQNPLRVDHVSYRASNINTIAPSQETGGFGVGFRIVDGNGNQSSPYAVTEFVWTYAAGGDNTLMASWDFLADSMILFPEDGSYIQLEHPEVDSNASPTVDQTLHVFVTELHTPPPGVYVR